MDKIAQGAEAIIYKYKDKVIKERVPKSYRVKPIDEELRKKRTRKEAKVLTQVSRIVNVPKVYSIDENKMKIEMDFVEGKKIKDILDDDTNNTYNNNNKDDKNNKSKHLCIEIGREIGLLHSKNITHGDLTTSNMILSNNKIYLIDFGLANHTNKVEDKAVELHLFRQALESKHHKIWEDCFKAFVEGYKSSNKDSTPILKKFEQVELRGRNKQKGS